MANTDTTSLNDLIPQIIAEAMFIAEERSIMRGLVRNFVLPAGAGKTIDVPIYGAQTAKGVAEGVDLTDGTDGNNVSVGTSSAQLVVSEVGIMTVVTDFAARAAQSNVVADVGRLFGEAIARKMDQDLTGLFSGFSVKLGDGTGHLSAADVFKAVAKLRAAAVPSDAIYCVLNPEVAYDLKAAITNTFADPNGGLLQNAAMQSGFVGTLAGVPVFESANVTGIGGLFHRESLGLAVAQDIRIEAQRDASLRATELVATAVYGKGKLYDGYGIGLDFVTSIV